MLEHFADFCFQQFKILSYRKKISSVRSRILAKTIKCIDETGGVGAYCDETDALQQPYARHRDEKKRNGAESSHQQSDDGTDSVYLKLAAPGKIMGKHHVGGKRHNSPCQNVQDGLDLSELASKYR